MKRPWRSIAALCTALLLFGLAGCGDDEDAGTGLEGAISIALSASTLTLVQGNSGSVTVTLSRLNGFTGAVAVTVDGLPTGVTAPAISIADGQTSGTLTVAAAATAAAATTALTVRATGAGVTAATAPLSLVVQAVPVAGFTMSLNPTTVPVAAGASGSTTVTIARTGSFTGAVALAATGLPTGVTASFNPQSVTGTTSTLTLTAAAGAAAGTATVTVTGSGTGVTNQTATLTVTVTAAAGFTMSLSPTTVPVTAGASGTSTLTITRTGGFAAAVALTATGAPTGMTVSFNPASATGTSSTVTVATTAAVAAGSHTITVRGNATGLAEQTATLTVTVTAATGGFTLALNPSTLTVQQGTSGNTTVTLTRIGGFADAVALAATGLPSGVTASFNPPSATGVTSTLTLTATAGAATGPATVTITGTGTGVTAQTATLNLTVSAASSGGGNVSAQFCASTGIPIWVAFQDGTGNWVQSTAVNGVYSGSVNSGRGGIAFVTQTGTTFTTTVRYGSLAELQGFNQVFCGGTTGTGKTVNVTVAGAAASDYVTMALGPSASFSFSGLSQPFQNVPDGAVDLLAARATAVGQLPNKLFALRGINPAAGSTVSVDFNGSNALDPVSAQLTIANLGADQAAFVATYSSANRGSLGYAIDAQLSTATTRTFNGFPTSAGSFHTLFVTAYPNTQTPDRYRLAGVVFASVAAKTVTLGPDMSTVAVTAAATTPVLRPQAVIPTSAQYNSFWVMTGSQTGSAPRSASVQISAAYLGTIPASVTAVVPDLSSAGYNTMWGLANTASTTWSVTATGTSGLGALGQNQEGATIAVGARQGTLPPQP